MTSRPRHVPIRLLAGVAAALALLVLGFSASPAGAHEGDAILTIEGVHPAGTQIHYIVRVTWENDGHPAADATVTATAVGADGTQLTPVTLAPVDSDGRFAGVLDYPSPGSWTVRVTSIDPTGSVEQAQEVTPPPTTEVAESGSEVTTGSGDGADDATEGGFAPADDGTGASGGDQAAAVGSDDGGMPVYLIVAAAAVVLIGAATAVNIIRRTGSRDAGDADDAPAARATGGDGRSGGSGTSASEATHAVRGTGEPPSGGPSTRDAW